MIKYVPIDTDHTPKTLSSRMSAILLAKNMDRTYATHIQDDPGLMAPSLRIISHKMLVTPMEGPMSRLE